MASDAGMPGHEEDIRPVVAAPRSSRTPWIAGGVLALVAVLLFQALEARRQTISAPTTFAPADQGAGYVAPATELSIPQQVPMMAGPYGAWPQPVILRTVPGTTIVPPAPLPGPARTSSPSRTSGPRAAAPVQPMWPEPAQANAGPPPGYGAQGSSPGFRADRAAAEAAPDKERVLARRFANPGTTVPKGTVIQAVLESALDSTRGGFARAIVSRDVFSFDGSRVLVQRGSRIIGEYKSDVAPGQGRILIQWQRLMRPDGVMIELGSPSADPLGRAGVKGSVNTHFFARFAGAILQSTLDIGVQLATRAASRDTVVVALPGSLQQATQVVQPERIQPTIKVRQGTSVSVFVASDLDFTAVQ